MGNPFDDEEASYVVLVNNEGQHSLWPAAVDVPLGWQTAFGRAGRQECLDYVTEHWTDLRPLSLVDALSRQENQGT